MNTITDRIKKEIKGRNLNITDFSKEIGVSRETIYNFSDDTIKYATVKKIAEVLDLPISFFINDEDEKKQKVNKAGAKKNNLDELIAKETRLVNELKSVNSEVRQELKKLKKQLK